MSEMKTVADLQAKFDGLVRELEGLRDGSENKSPREMSVAISQLRTAAEWCVKAAVAAGLPLTADQEKIAADRKAADEKAAKAKKDEEIVPDPAAAPKTDDQYGSRSRRGSVT